MKAYVAQTNPAAPDVAHLYLELGPKLRVRGDLAYAQALQETNYFRYGGIVKPEQNNYAGIGATDAQHPGASFATPADGVLAHLQHLYAYAATAPLPAGMAKIDPRFDLITRGSATWVGDLNGVWAVPGTDYGQTIDRILGEMLAMPLAGDPYSITKAYLDTTSKNRPGECDGTNCWLGVKGIVVHRTASPSQNARAIRQYFNDSPDGRFASSQYVVDDKEALQLMPVGEIAFHTIGKNLTHLGIETCEYNWGSATWPETYRKLVWLTGYLARVYQLTIADVSGHFWWDTVNRPYDPTHMTWTPAEGKDTGIFDWNQFIADVNAQLTPSSGAPAPTPVPVQMIKVVDCTQGLLINSTTYVPIRPYTDCVAPNATLQWDPNGPNGARVLVQLPDTGAPAPAPAATAAIGTVGAAAPDPAAPKPSGGFWKRLFRRGPKTGQ
ncbi:MAG TPA: N-acetylmuramoyl-L-alanine amidase [Symbiobacteriaceae bacterium]|jgi:hypothetical protein